MVSTLGAFMIAAGVVWATVDKSKGRAAIWQVDRQTGAARVFASGLRNPNGLMFNPQSGVLWAVINEPPAGSIKPKR